MKAVVQQGPGKIDLQKVPDARIDQPGDAVVRLTMSAICGTDLHMVRGTLPGMMPGTVLGHEGVGIVEAVGREVRGFRPGERVVIPSTLCCGTCSYCRAGYTSQRDRINPNGRLRGPRSSADRSPPARFRACRRLMRECHTPRRT